MQVADVLASVGNVEDEDLLIAALLHDTIEDTSTTGEEIETLFGADVLGIVNEVTDDKSLEKAERKRLQVDRAATKSGAAKQLKLADKICNIRDLTTCCPVGWSLARKREYVDWAEQVVAGCKGVNERLDWVVDAEIAAARERLS